MSGAWSDGAPMRGYVTVDNSGLDYNAMPYDRGNNALYANTPAYSEPVAKQSIPSMLTSKVGTIRQFEGLRGRSTRAALVVKYLNQFIFIIILAGIAERLTQGVPYASGGGKYMLFSCSVVALVGAGATLFYVNLRRELLEKVRHYIFGIILVPGTLIACLLYVLPNWSSSEGGELGGVLNSVLPSILIAAVVLPALVFVKEILGIRTLHRSTMDDQEAVALWSRQDGLQN